MGKRGAKPAPTALKVLRGTHRKDRHGDPADEVSPATLGTTTPPRGLGPAGRARWKAVVKQLTELGVLTVLDVGALTTYCRAHDEIAKCDRVLAKDGEYFSTEGGYIGQHPAVNQRFKWLDVKRRYEGEFGLTASARCGLKATKKTKAGVPARSRA